MPKFKKTRIKLSIHLFLLCLIGALLFLFSTIIFPLFGGDQVLAPEGGNYSFIYGFNFLSKFISDIPSLFAFQGNIIVSITLYLILVIFIAAVVLTILKSRFIMLLPSSLLLLEGAFLLMILDFFFNQFLYYDGAKVNYFTLILFNSSMSILILIYYWIVLIITFISAIIYVILFLSIILSPKKVKNEKEVLEKEEFEASYPTVFEIRKIIKEELDNYFKSPDQDEEKDEESQTEQIINNAKEDNYNL